MATITFIRPYLHAWSAHKINVCINNVKLLELHSGDEQVIELEEGYYNIQVNGFLFRSSTQNISLEKDDSKIIYVFLDFLSRGRFCEKTQGMFLFKAPLGISDKLQERSDSSIWNSLPVFQSIFWLVFVLFVGLIPATVELATTKSIYNLIVLLSVPLFLLLSLATVKKFLSSKSFFYWELHFASLLLLFVFFFQENIQQPTMIASLCCASALVALFVIKYAINKHCLVRK
ncbi:MAG: hypothetical protein LBM67_04015 [Lentimicrobiaceae bacterium]|jgi:hypothetical protein|nr:hypothetical protein [Lentimicrobiaceae bacterium]